MKEKRKRELKVSLIVVGGLSALICGWSLIFRSHEGGSLFAVWNGLFCGLVLVGAGLGYNELNGKVIKRPGKGQEKCSEE